MTSASLQAGAAGLNQQAVLVSGLTGYVPGKNYRLLAVSLRYSTLASGTTTFEGVEIQRPSASGNVLMDIQFTRALNGLYVSGMYELEHPIDILGTDSVGLNISVWTTVGATCVLYLDVIELGVSTIG